MGNDPGEPSEQWDLTHLCGPQTCVRVAAEIAREHRSQLVVRDGTRYLFSQQNADGGYTSVPDQAGPRPLPYSIPALANHSVLLAMTYLNPNLNLSDTASALLSSRE